MSLSMCNVYVCIVLPSSQGVYVFVCPRGRRHTRMYVCVRACMRGPHHAHEHDDDGDGDDGDDDDDGADGCFLLPLPEKESPSSCCYAMCMPMAMPHACSAALQSIS
jgi:hypothetical protein